MDITQDIDKIIVEGEELPFVKVKTLHLTVDHSVVGIIVRTHEKIKKFYDALWSQDEVALTVNYKNGSFHYKVSKIITIKDGINGQYEYHFFGV
ncbi:hypothetical protein [Bacillus sp. FSL R10-2780]|uniref:hypothetical protein n=1 Tax=Bacillus sp. FSL R10-2780 TaxID=2954660 RepID=UPI0030FA566C